MTVYKRPGSPYWQIEFQYLGVKVRESSGTESKARAKELEDHWRREIHDRVKSGKQAKPSITFGDAIDRYYASLPPGKVLTRKKDLYVLNKLRKHFGADTLLSDITMSEISDYRDDILIGEAGMMHASANRELSYLRRVFNKAREDGKDVPAWEVKFFRERADRVRWLTPDQEERLFNECSEYVRSLVIFLADSGCRKGEALTLRWQDVTILDDDTAHIAVRATETKQGTAVGKRLPKRAAKMLAEMKRETNRELVFVDAGGNPLNQWTVRAEFNAAVLRAKIDDFRVHDLRHHYASRLVQHGVPLLEVSKLLGHTTTKMTERYAHLAPHNLADAVARLDDAA